jgi:hypothetical protein
VGLIGSDSGVAGAHQPGAGGVQGGAVGQDHRQPVAHRRVDASRARHDTGGHGDHTAAGGELLQDRWIGVDAVGGEERAVLDRVGAYGQGIGHSLAAVGVDGQGQPGGVGLLDRDRQFGSPELGLVRPDRRGHVPAAGHDLDDVDAASRPFPHRGADGVANGLTNREAARKLYLSPHTVDSHLRHIFFKLNIRSRVELARLFASQTTSTRSPPKRSDRGLPPPYLRGLGRAETRL